MQLFEQQRPVWPHRRVGDRLMRSRKAVRIKLEVVVAEGQMPRGSTRTQEWRSRGVARSKSHIGSTLQPLYYLLMMLFTII